MPPKLKKFSVPLKLISLDQEGFHLMLKAKINNRVARLILDTGASKTVFDKNKIRKYINHDQFEKNEHLSTGLGTDTMESHSVLIEKLVLGDMVINDFKLVLLDLKHISQSYELMGLPTVDGVLGGDILKHYLAIIDYEKLQISMHQKSLKKKSKQKK